MVFQEGFRNNLDEISETKGLNESVPGILVLHLEVSVQMGFLARDQSDDEKRTIANRDF
jgi:hypothetical protein